MDNPDCRLILGDCVAAMAALPDESVDAIVCDPPYGLEFMGKDWDTFRVDKRSSRWSARSGAAGGFSATELGVLPAYGKRRTTSMCMTCGKRDAFRNPHKCGEDTVWKGILVDVTPVEMRAFQNWVTIWADEAYRILKPGGHLLAFGGSRTYHRLASGIEDAGFAIRDSLHWIYGTGFPKSHDVSKQIDKRLGGEREVVGHHEGDMGGLGGERLGQGGGEITEPASEEAKRWEGWGTALKPAHEPVVLARKHTDGTIAANVLAYGTGALNIAGARIGESGGAAAVPGTRSKATGATDFPGRAEMAKLDAGRWPANVLFAHLPGCEGSGAAHTETLCVPGCPVAELNESERGAACFFYIAKPRPRERVGGTLRNLHPTVKPIDLMRYLVRLVTPPGGVVLDPFLGSGSTGCAAMVEGFRFIGIERDEDSFETSLARISDYAFANGRERPEAVTVPPAEGEQADDPAEASQAATAAPAAS